jgi:hypothetical protein
MHAKDTPFDFLNSRDFKQPLRLRSRANSSTPAKTPDRAAESYLTTNVGGAPAGDRDECGRMAGEVNVLHA